MTRVLFEVRVAELLRRNEMAVHKKFNENIEYFGIPKTMAHNIIRGTDTDITGFWVKLYIITAIHRKKQFYNKNTSTSLLEVYHNTPIPYSTMHDYKEEGKRRYSMDNIYVSRKDKKYFFWSLNRSLDRELNTMNYKVGKVDLSTPTEEDKLNGYKTSYYAYKADKYFAGYIKTSGKFMEALNIKISPTQLRVLLCVMVKVVNPKPGYFPTVNIRDICRYTNFKPFKVLEILNKLYEKGLIICEHLDKIKTDPQIVYIGKGIDSSAEHKIKDYIEMETAEEFTTLSGIPEVRQGELNELI